MSRIPCLYEELKKAAPQDDEGMRSHNYESAQRLQKALAIAVAAVAAQATPLTYCFQVSSFPFQVTRDTFTSNLSLGSVGLHPLQLAQAS
jgi:hypothetical protein